MADIFGTYIESKIQGNIDWIFGDDNISTLGTVDRRLDSPGNNFDCYLEVKNLKSPHNRGRPLGYWFYLLTVGNTSLQIPSIGIDKAMEIVMATLKELNNNSDYPDMMKSSLKYVLNKYGRCSSEFISVAQAWEHICVPTGYANPNGSVTSCFLSICQSEPELICEESNSIEFCACGQYPYGSGLNWTIIGPKSTEFSSFCGMQGNSQLGGNCLTITHIPDYPYYPQYLKIRLYSPTMCNMGIRPCIIEKVLKIQDCDHDDPHCDYGNQSLISSESEYELLTKSLSSENEPAEWHELRVFDVYGKLLFRANYYPGIISDFSYFGLAIYCYYDDNGNLVNCSKRFENFKN